MDPEVKPVLVNFVEHKIWIIYAIFAVIFFFKYALNIPIVTLLFNNSIVKYFQNVAPFSGTSQTLEDDLNNSQSANSTTDTVLVSSPSAQYTCEPDKQVFNVSNNLFLHPRKHVLHVIKKTADEGAFDADLKTLVTQYMKEYMPDTTTTQIISRKEKSKYELRFAALKIFDLTKTPGGNEIVGNIEFQARQPYYADGKTKNGYLFFYQKGIGEKLNKNVLGFGGFVSAKKLSNKTEPSKKSGSPKKSKLKF